MKKRQEEFELVVAIDPGTTHSAFVIMCKPLDCIVEFGKMANEDLLKHLRSKKFYFNLVIEEIQSYGMPVGKTVFDTCIWTGRFLQGLGGSNESLIPRRTVKLHCTGSVKTTDKDVRSAMLKRYPEAKEKGVTKDVWAALALGSYYIDMRGEKYEKKV